MLDLLVNANDLNKLLKHFWFVLIEEHNFVKSETFSYFK